ncbi:MAG: ureidoglycolate lyase [Leptolyngbyaceae cyanobacterium bins.59]|nr:ureidoglycolate lyase [Leptolyngbyaceae cyanobacterium bins.59]
MSAVEPSSDLLIEIERFQRSIVELEERLVTLDEQSAVRGIHISRKGSPEEILRACMLQAELHAQREAEAAGVARALQIMQEVLAQKQALIQGQSEGEATPSTVKRLPAEPITPKGFQPYGQVIWASEDGQAYGPEDAQLNLSNGIPRFYIMRLKQKGRQFHRITRHQRCTQCLGSLEGKSWWLAVAPPSATPQPPLEAIVAFQIPGNCFVNLEVGTWHAGPYFSQDFVDFYNLELSDTNITDHDTCNLLEHYGVRFEICP